MSGVSKLSRLAYMLLDDELLLMEAEMWWPRIPQNLWFELMRRNILSVLDIRMRILLMELPL